MATTNNGDEDGVSIRPMRLKVLYTFDDQNKTNCLARGQEVLQIKTVMVDETTAIGIIELKACIEAVVQCSPEIVARLGQADYTIYAYDYSEYDNPLVGQGMLSWALATSSPDPDAPAQQSQKLVTGRVCKNIMGLFNNGIKETLEVKLRLIPVPTAVQNEYASTMELYREKNSAIPAGFDHNEWTRFMQSNPNMSQMASNFAPPGSTASNPRGNMEVVNQLLSPRLSQSSQTPPEHVLNGEASASESHGGPSNAGNSKKTSRPSSRASIKRPRAKRQPKTTTPAAAGGNTSGYEEGTDGDDGPAPKKKRAKTIKADWSSKSSFGTAPDSLRVAASTAGSLRLFRPIATASGPAGASHLQDIPRAPTPVPMMPNQAANTDRGRSQTESRRGSYPLITEPRRHISPYPPLQPAPSAEEQIRESIESANPSPERQYSPALTPSDIGSSPPVVRTASIMRSSPPCPSSPVLPQMPRPEDSGFMSGAIDELFGDDDEIAQVMNDEGFESVAKDNGNNTQLPTNHDTSINSFHIEEETPGPMELLPSRMPIFARKTGPRSRAASIASTDDQRIPVMRQDSRSQSRLAEADIQQPQHQAQLLPQPPHDILSDLVPARPTAAQNDPTLATGPQSRPVSRMMVRTASMGSLTLPTVPASDPGLPPSSLQRSHTWSDAPYPVMDAMMPIDMHMAMPMNGPVPTSFALKKANIKQRLEAAIAKGEMPPFCTNCGEIETPTWRRAFSQDQQGSPGYYDFSDEAGRVTALNILTRDDSGQPTSYQILKKVLGPDDDKAAWTPFQLCNPCGIWMSKYKSHRPPERWAGGDKSRAPAGVKRKKGRGSRAKNAASIGAAPTSEANFLPSEANLLQSEAYFPPTVYPHSDVGFVQETSTQEPEVQILRVTLPEVDKVPEVEDGVAASRPAKRLNAMTSGAASAALRRALKSSPARWTGGPRSPSADDDGLGSTRRILFPTPRKDGSPKVLGEIENNARISESTQSSKEQSLDALDKENCPPQLGEGDVEDDLLKFFADELARPTTPVQATPSRNHFKTPTRPTPSHRPITRSVSRSQRSAKSANERLSISQRTPSKTPTSALRRSPRKHLTFESPFTASIAQMMSEANNGDSPSRLCSDLDFGFGDMHDLPMMGEQDLDNVQMSLEDFFSKGNGMASSPPKPTGFMLYEDPVDPSLSDINWSDFETGQFGGDLMGTSTAKTGADAETATDTEPAAAAAQPNTTTELETKTSTTTVTVNAGTTGQENTTVTKTEYEAEELDEVDMVSDMDR